MINLIRGKVNNEITNDVIGELLDLNFLIKNNKIEINSKTLTLNTLERIIEFTINNSVQLDIYFNKWTEIENSIINDVKVNFINFPLEHKVDYKILNDLNILTEEEKNSIAISLAADTNDLRLLNEAMNKGTLTINNFIKRMVAKHA